MNNKEVKAKISLAFEMLADHEIAAMEDYSCCMSCGAKEIQIYRKEYPKGYAFYHMQDTETLEKDGYVYIAYGGFGKNKDEDIACQVIAMIEKYGVSCQWNGQIDTRIRAGKAKHESTLS